MALAPAGRPAAFCQWDCNWYVSIAQSGYHVPQGEAGHAFANVAFFPIYPVLLRGIVSMTGLSYLASGLAAGVFTLWALAYLGWRTRDLTRPVPHPWTWLAVLLCWPYSLYFTVPYSEGVFAALLSACLLATVTGRFWLAAASSALLSATRPTGLLFAIPIALQLLRRAKSACGGKARAAAPVLLSPLGAVLFMIYLWVEFGDPMAFMHVQHAWGRTLGNPFSVVSAALGTADIKHRSVGIAYEAMWSIAGLGAAMFLAFHRRFTEAWLCLGTVAAALLSGSVGSMPRFVAANPVFLFAATDMLGAVPAGLRALILIACAGMQIVFVIGWVHGAHYLI